MTAPTLRLDASDAPASGPRCGGACRQGREVPTSLKETLRAKLGRVVGAAAVAALVGLSTSAAVAQGRGLAGDWSCGDTRLSLTALGSIEVVEGQRYRAGLYRQQGERLTITWDEGGASTVTARLEGESMVVEGLPGGRLSCRARR